MTPSAPSGPYDLARQREADMDFWQLTPSQRYRYLGRISRYHGREAERFLDLAATYGRKARRWLITAVVLWALSLISLLVGAIR